MSVPFFPASTGKKYLPRRSDIPTHAGGAFRLDKWCVASARSRCGKNDAGENASIILRALIRPRAERAQRIAPRRTGGRTRSSRAESGVSRAIDLSDFDRSPADRSMGAAIEIEIDMGLAIDLSDFDRSPADRSMGAAIEIEIDMGRAIDLSDFDRSPADRSMGAAIASNATAREARHV
jgi:hypothetical protein